MRQTRINTALPYHLRFLDVALSESGPRFDTVEVRSSSLLVPTIYFPAFRSGSPHLFNPRSNPQGLLQGAFQRLVTVCAAQECDHSHNPERLVPINAQ
jgi:hypothetical protein